MSDSIKELAARNGDVVPRCEARDCLSTAWWQMSGRLRKHHEPRDPKVCAEHKERAILDGERIGAAVYFHRL